MVKRPNGAARRRRTDNDRLTGRRDGRAYIVGCPDFALPKIAGLIIQQTVDRLAAIEDILGEEYDLERLRELAQADRERRCVVLPIGGYSDKDGEKALKNAMFVCSLTNNAVNRYTADAIAEKLTRADAEAALRREQE